MLEENNFQNSFVGVGEKVDEVTRKRQMEEITNLIKEGNFTGPEFRTAYEMSIGLAEDEVSHPDKVNDGVRELALKLKGMSERGLSLTIITEVLKGIENKDSVLDLYFSFVDNLSITDKEKVLLRNIVKDKRAGSLIIAETKTLRELAQVTIPKFPEDNYPTREVIARLILALSLSKGGEKIEVSFMS